MKKQLYLPEEQNDVLWTVIGVGSPWGLLGLWLVLINLAAFLAFGWDKWKAKYKETHPNARRVPEKNLFLLAIFGGSLGALLGMKVFHHKTLHKGFRYGIPAILAVQVLLAGGLWLYFNVIR